jgi:D-alanyl-lipoteichoic acid acyltransferase DltB (MBOAT superfamily)
VLGYYKYALFAAENLRAVFGIDPHLGTIFLPIGISFFTFTQIAFLCDAYGNDVSSLNISRYGLFVSFFPHCIAGPILHHKSMMDQFALARVSHWIPDHVSAGILYFTIGLAKKVLIADSCAPWANALFDSTVKASIVEAWMGSVSYAMQLYFDFSGYSDMAIGLGWLFNIKFPENFNAPYRATSISDFWRRWHITLSNFLRDYVLYSFGGNRGKIRRYVNMFLTMLVAGLWHGAAWTFVIWGGVHGAMLVVHRLWSQSGRSLPNGPARIVTFLCVVITWIVFRASRLSAAAGILGQMFDFRSFRLDHLRLAPGGLIEVTSLLILLVIVNCAPTAKEFVETRKIGPLHAIAFALLFGVCLLLMRDAAIANRKSEFIYFQF